MSTAVLFVIFGALLGFFAHQYWLQCRRLQCAQARLSHTQRVAGIGTWERNLATGARFWSEESYRLFEMEPVEVAPREDDIIRRFVHPEDRARVTQWVKSLDTDHTSGEIICRIRLPQGRQKILHVTPIYKRNAAGRPVRISGTVHDITQQEETARQLHRHEEEFRLLVESSPDLILRFNQDMRCVYANPAIQHALGLSPSQIVSKHLQEIPLPTNLRRVWSNSIRKVLETRQSSLFEYSFATATGRKHFQTRVVPAFDVRTGVRHALAIAQDVSALKENEVMLRELSAHTEMVREQERKKIAREVHDELGQALTALRMDAALLRLDLGDEHPCSARVDNMKKALDHTLKIARDVTTALRPAALDLGLIAALEWLVNDFRRHFGWTCFLHTNSECARLDDSRATALFRIVQESLNNVAKHADATEVMVSVLLQPKEIYLEVCDNGVGFDLGARRQPQSFGLLGIGERVRMLNGSLEIESSPQTGTRLKVVLPLATNRLNTSASNKLEEQP